MSITSLGYIGVNSKKLADWDDFATNLLGNTSRRVTLRQYGDLES